MQSADFCGLYFFVFLDMSDDETIINYRNQYVRRENMIFMAIAMGCNVGCAVIISQLFGAKRYQEMKTAVSTTLIASFVLSLLFYAKGVWKTKGMRS